MARRSEPSSAAPPSAAPEFSRPIRVAEADRAPRLLKGEATEAERAALARRFDILALDSLSYEAELRPWRDGGWRAKGVVRAQAAQACVVTLEPAPETIEESFARGWLPARALPESKAKPDSETEVYMDPELDDPPELLGEEIDLGEVAAEVFGLALDPYPRAPGLREEGREEEGAVFTAAPPGAEPLTEATIHPFARLKALKEGGEGPDKP
ncbi:YceD family protein [Neomegalonema perideroedes]|uniref:YceD family protein n=1 Tax=Neomegalonema perideroedes TaxID=217219 RepID=UPI00037EDF73|nr:YceD family protein [Neomegalonema perideroedes]